MASHVILGGDGPEVVPPANILAPAAVINLRGFQWTTVDDKLHPKELRKATPKVDHVPQQHPLEIDELHRPQEEFRVAEALAPSARAAAQATPIIVAPPPLAALKPAPPFPLTQLQGAFAGNGFNTIFRPRSDSDETFPTSQLSSMDLNNTLPPNQALPPDNILELNLTTEQLTFDSTIGDIPNRGLGQQPDIKNLQGFAYLQKIQDVTNLDTGRGDSPLADSIHFEPGMFLFVPANPSTPNKDNAATVVRMASIPHGTTINAQGVVPSTTPIPHAPDFTGDGAADITPFLVKANGSTQPFGFPSMKVDKANTLRLPQNLSKFKTAGTFSDEIIQNPNLMLEKALHGLKVVEFITFEVSTGPPNATVGAGGTANIAFLQGTPATAGISTTAVAGNANAAFMKYRIWIETIEYDIDLPTFFQPNASALLKPTMPKGSTAPTPQFLILPPPGARLPLPKHTVKVRGLQLQYSQTVNLNFGGLIWPHVSVATLVPKDPQPITLAA